MNQMLGGEVLFSFEGEITEELVGSTLKLMETRLESGEADVKMGRKVYNITVEALQNLYHHIDKSEGGVLASGASKKDAMFIVTKKNGEYNILAANYIEKAGIAKMKARLDKINSLDKDGLRDHYKEVLTNGQFSIHGGGGLGMIDIARKSGNPLGYDFSDVDDNYGLYILKIKV